MQNIEAFRNNFLVVGLPTGVIDEIAALADYQVFAANDVIIRRGEQSKDLYVILEGTAAVYSEGNDKLANVGTGSVLGEIALVDDQPRSADVLAVGLTKVAKLPAQALRRYMSQNKDAGFIMLANLARVLSMRLRNSQVVLEDLKAKANEDPWKYAL